MYTIEQIEELTGYSKNTIYSLTSNLDLKPYRNHVKGNPSKGSYDQLTVDTLLEYKRLTSLNRASKKMAISMAKAFYEERSQQTT